MIIDCIYFFWLVIDVLTYGTNLFFCFFDKKCNIIVIFFRNCHHGILEGIHQLRRFLYHQSTILVNQLDLLLLAIFCTFFHLFFLLYLDHFTHHQILSLVPFINQSSSQIYFIILQTPFQKFLHYSHTNLSYFWIHPFLRNHVDGNCPYKCLILWY